MLSLREASNRLREASEAIDSSKPVVLEELPVGRAFAQGDIAALAIPKLPKGATKIAMPTNGQLAPGNTKGSRHCIAAEDQANVTVYNIDDGDALSNLCIEATAPWTLQHPEHAWVTFPAGTYRMLHQQNEQYERVRD